MCCAPVGLKDSGSLKDTNVDKMIAFTLLSVLASCILNVSAAPRFHGQVVEHINATALPNANATSDLHKRGEQWWNINEVAWDQGVPGFLRRRRQGQIRSSDAYSIGNGGIGMSFWGEPGQRTRGGVAARTTETLKARQGVCTRIVLPDGDYSGVAPTFYGLGRDWPTHNPGDLGELDFEYIKGDGRSLDMVIHFPGGGYQNLNHAESHPANMGVTLCLANWGDVQQWFVNGVKRAEHRSRMTDLTLFWTIWKTDCTGCWEGCCGPLKNARTFNMKIWGLSFYDIVE